MKLHPLQLMIAFLGLWLFGTYALDAEDHQNYQQINPQLNPQIKENVKILNELSERRRINTLFNNQQSPFYGLQKDFVNLTKGNVTFSRRDMVVAGRIPIVIARVYDSSAAMSTNMATDFSPGWQLTLAQTITPQSDGSLLHQNDSDVVERFVPNGQGYQLVPAQNSDIKTIKRNSLGIRIDYRNGWYKQFTLIDNQYHLSTIVDNNGNQIRLDYQNGLLSEIIGANNRKVNIYRDDQQRIITIIDEQNRSVNYHYNNKGLLNTVIDIGQNHWHYRYQPNNQLKKIIDPLNQLTARFKYYNQGLAAGKIKVSKIRAQQYRYHYKNNQTIITDLNGNKSYFEHNKQGITTKVTNNQGFSSQIKLNQHNQITELWHNGIQQAEIIYQPNGKLSQITNLINNSIQQYHYETNTLGELITVTDHNQQTQRYQYDAKSNLTSYKNNKEQRHYHYNDFGDITLETHTFEITPPQTLINNHSNLQPLTIEYQHNSDGLLTQLKQQNQTTTTQASFDYNLLGKLDKITFPNGAVHHYHYNALGFRTHTLRSDNSQIHYDYDSLGNLRQQTDINGSKKANQQITTQILTVNQYNQITQVDMATDTKDFAPVIIKYNKHNNPELIIQGKQQIDYHYDSLSRLTDIANGSGVNSHYHYQTNETDIRAQLDNRTATTLSNNHNVTHHNQNLSSLLYTRTTGNPWQVIHWSDSLNQFILASTDTVNSSKASFESAKQRARLRNALAMQQQQQSAFDKASNSFFIPPEYRAINCYYGCEASTYKINKPATAMVGQAVNIEVIEQDQKCLMAYYLDVEGTSILSTTGKFTHIFKTPGLHPIKVRGLCQMCPWTSKEVTAYIHVEPAPKCSVDFEITGTNNFKISTTPTMPTIRARVTNKFPAHATIEWSAQIEHTVPNNGACSGVINTNSPENTATGNTFEPNWGSSIYGGDLFITATCRAPGYESYSQTFEDYEIKGTEPSNTNYTTAFAGGLTAPLDPHDLRRIACKESHLKHFTSNGMPLYGSGGGGDVGVMQICYQRQVRHIWNYQSNIAYGRAILNGQKVYAQRSLNAQMNQNHRNTPTQWTQDMLRAEIIHRYNAGSSISRDRYWEWDDSNQGRWVAVAQGGVGGYFTSVNSKPANCTN